jgi:hypothetical protein
MTASRAVARILGLTAGLTMLAACASAPPPAHPPPAAGVEALRPSDIATVYIYRTRAFLGMALRPTVMLDGKDLVNVGNGRVFVAGFQPSKHLFKMDDGNSGAELDLQAGQAYYLKIEIVPGFWKGGGKLSHVTPEQGGVEIQGLRPVEQKEIEDPSFLDHSAHTATSPPSHPR